MTEWINVTHELPQNDKPVLTKIQEPGNVERNVQVLKNGLVIFGFFQTAVCMFYYEPTHWKEVYKE